MTRITSPGIGLPAIGLFMTLLASPAVLRAHAVVVESEPSDGARLRRPPAQVFLRFNAKIEKALTRVVLTTGAGRVVALPSFTGKGAGGEAPDRFAIPLPPLAPGDYVLRYRVLATDGHATPGILRFTVNEGPPDR